MRSLLLSLILLISVSTFGADERYQRAIVFQGGGFQTAFMLGMLDGAEKMGHSPDTVIGTCGGAIAAAIVNAFPNVEDQKRFVESRQFYEFLRSISFVSKNQNLWGAARIALEMRQTAYEKIIPDIFHDFLMNIPFNFEIPELDRPLGFGKRHIVIVGARASFDPGEVGTKIKGKLFQEVLFSDPDSQVKLRNFESPIADEFPNSDVAKTTETSTDLSGSQAARIGISDMFYMAPVFYRDHYYLSGAIDLYPLELAKTLAHEVIFGFSGGFDTLVEDPAIASTYGYDQNVRLQHVNDQRTDYWVDLTDESALFKTVGFNPKPNIKTFSVQKRIPQTYEDYLTRVRQLWKIGYDRAVEALNLPKGDKHHIRFLKSDNSSNDLRQALGSE